MQAPRKRKTATSTTRSTPNSSSIPQRRTRRPDRPSSSARAAATASSRCRAKGTKWASGSRPKESRSSHSNTACPTDTARCRSKTPKRHCATSATMPRSTASILRAWASWASRRAAIWPLRPPRCSPKRYAPPSPYWSTPSSQPSRANATRDRSTTCWAPTARPARRRNGRCKTA